MSVRAVFFDGMGTLIAMAPPAERLAGWLASQHGVSIQALDARTAFEAEINHYRSNHRQGRDADSLARLRADCARVLHRNLPREIRDRVDERELLVGMLQSLRFSLFPDALPALAELRARDLRLFVVSNWDVSLTRVIEDLGALPLLDGVITSAQVGHAKPDPVIFKDALAGAGVDASQAVHVGDSPELDVVGARAAGIEPVLLLRGGRDKGRLRGIDCNWISSLEQLSVLLEHPPRRHPPR